jgi:quinol monooxygenase YgiN
MVHVLAIITTKPGQRDTVLQLFKANVPHVLAEQGCIEYVAAIDMQGGPPSQTLYGPYTFVVIEKWSDFDALKAHSVAPHMVAYAKSTKDLLVNRAIHILQDA